MGPVADRHAREVAEAGKVAIEEYKRDHPDVPDKIINVELPKVKKLPQNNQPPRPAFAPLPAFGAPLLPPPLAAMPHHLYPPPPLLQMYHPPPLPHVVNPRGLPVVNPRRRRR